MNELFSNQPKSLKILFLAEFVERFSYWGLQSLLILYLTKSLGVTSDKAYVIYGTFTACTFAWSILGGLIADLILGFRRAIIIGATLAVEAYKNIAAIWETVASDEACIELKTIYEKQRQIYLDKVIELNST